MNETKQTDVIERDAETLAEHVLDGVEGVSGVSHDGRLVWLVNRATQQLEALDPATGTVERRIAGLRVGSGLTFDGRHLWGCDGDKILEIEPESGEVLRTIDVPPGGSGLAWAEGVLWLGQYRDRKILKIDPETGEVLKTLDSDRLVTGVTWIDDQLWHGAWEKDDEPHVTELRRVDESETSVEKILEAARTVIDSEPLLRVDYIELVDRNVFTSIDVLEKESLLVMAIHCGTTRLLDNVLLSPGDA